jgi:phosphohistidine phosphatase
MAKQLWFLRHGEAEPHEARPDHERRLTARGERQSRAAGEALAQLGLEFDRVLTSPKVRGYDTARLAGESLGLEPEVDESLAGGFDREDALRAMGGAGDDARVLMVGHEPDFSQTIKELTGADVDLKKGGVAGVRLHSDTGELITLLRPRELESIAMPGDRQS